MPAAGPVSSTAMLVSVVLFERGAEAYVFTFRDRTRSTERSPTYPTQRHTGDVQGGGTTADDVLAVLASRLANNGMAARYG